MKIEEDVSLADLGTMRVGGRAHFFCGVENIDELREAIYFANARNLSFVILGSGSNMYFSDAPFSGLVIKIKIPGIMWQKKKQSMVARVGAGEDWDAFVYASVKKGFSGLENLSFIPGTVGASPVQNIGAYGAEVKGVVSYVETIDSRTGNEKKFSNDDCRFGYRDSFFKTREGRNYIVTHVSFNFKKDAKKNTSYKDLEKLFQSEKDPSVHEIREAVITIRKKKLPDPKFIGTLGSFFKNPIVDMAAFSSLQKKFLDLPAFEVSKERYKLSAAWLIDRGCGLKAYRQGKVGTYHTQPLAIVNYGGATAMDVRKFAQYVKEQVRYKSGITLEEEVRFIENDKFPISNFQ